MRSPLTVGAGLALVLGWGGLGAGLAQAGLADSIVGDSGVPGLDLVVSESVDFAAEGVVAPEGEELPIGWVKVFAGDQDTVSIIAVEYRSGDTLRAGLAGAMADIARDDRRPLVTLEGVVVGATRRQSRAVRYALYGEGMTGFTIAASGPNRDQNAERVLLAQLEHSVGDRFPLRADESERYLGRSDATGLAYDLGRFVGGGLLVIGLVALVQRYRKRGGAGGDLNVDG